MHSFSPSRSRWQRGLALVAAGTLVASGAVVIQATTTTAPATADAGECPPGYLPFPDNGNEIFSDDNVAVYAGGDFEAIGGAAEVEGVLVVEGDADIDKSPGGVFNVGWVGVGSGVAPTPGEVMFAVGGSLSVGSATTLHVGANADDGAGNTGGDVQVGDLTDPPYATNPGTYDLFGGTLTESMGADATAEWASWGDTITQQSALFAGMDATPAVVTPGTLIFAGDGSDPQVFTVDAAALEANPAISFTGIADDTPVIINILGDGGADGVVWAPNYFEDDGVRADAPGTDRFGVVAGRTMWNFVDATSVQVAGSSQVLGSIMVPASVEEPTLTITASTNGRIYTNGTILMNGSGNEMHNYPWNYGPFQCVPVPGAFEIVKQVEGEGAPDVAFTGTWQCVSGETVVAEGLWQASAGESSGALVAPLDSVCTITEDTPDDSPGGTWEDPVISPNPVTITAGSDHEPIVVTVTNTWTPDATEGAFVVTKVVEGEGAPDVTFTGDWSCTLDGDVVADGTWAAAAGETDGPFVAPVDAVCSVTEDTPENTQDGFWDVPVVSGSPVTITADSAQSPVEVTVTNTWTPGPNDLVGAFEIVKVVEGEGAPDATFSGDWSCTLDSETVVEGTWTASAGQTAGPFSAPVGSTCSVEEATPAAAPDGYWEQPVIDGSPVVITEGSTLEPLTVTVTNTWVPSTVDVFGSFEITKVVQGAGAPDVTFTGTWDCAVDDTTVAQGTWRAADGETAGPFIAPVDAVCTVAEDDVEATDAGSWGTPEIAGSPVTITAASAQAPIEVVVTNTYLPVLPVTGADVSWWGVGIGGALVVAGIGALTFAGVRRRA
ncbi:DUF5979 domain-containing protein [Microbacterium sp. C7(2022)]|uniref:DUF5979 domain-containing protein n=1 Tax=Microbacterium sp. C7(2022) TaxID=2992759 RepID=UPI00237B1D5C|nr:DUF5979 domain-containing protein [Microbacterium sp. C7(2022)]MDE0545340.1 DUF5979 domain-containing protein [Microbacterium sp. C7(2022)]